MAGKEGGMRQGRRREKGVIEEVVGDMDQSLDGLLDLGALTGTDSYRGSRPCSREGRGGARQQGTHGDRGRGGGSASPVRRADGSWDYGHDSRALGSGEVKYGDASAHHWIDDDAPDSPPVLDEEEVASREEVASHYAFHSQTLGMGVERGGGGGGQTGGRLPLFGAPEFGTETERFHIAPGHAQIMPTYLRLQVCGRFYRCIFVWCVVEYICICTYLTVYVHVFICLWVYICKSFAYLLFWGSSCRCVVEYIYTYLEELF